MTTTGRITTLVATDVPATSLDTLEDSQRVTGAVAWTFEVDDVGVVTAHQRDPATMADVRTATTESGLIGQIVRWSGFPVGEDSYYVVGAQEPGGDEDVPTTTHI